MVIYVAYFCLAKRPYILRFGNTFKLPTSIPDALLSTDSPEGLRRWAWSAAGSTFGAT